MIAALALAAGLGPTAEAGGYYYSDSGIVATSRGGAFVAGADNQFAQYYNPAGLIHVDRPTFNLGVSAVQQNVTFDRLAPEGSGGPQFLPSAVNEAAPFIIPQLGFTTPLIADELALAIGFASPFAPSADYDPEGAQRYVVKDTLIFQFSVGPSVAWRPFPELTVGLGLQWQYLQVGESLDVTLNGLDDPESDIAVEVQVVDPFTPNFNAGLLLDPIPELTFGFAIQPPTHFKATGPLDIDFTGNSFMEIPLLSNAKYNDEVSLDVDLPWVARAGVAVRPIPRLEIEAAVVWQNWAALSDLLISDIHIELDSDSPVLSEEQRLISDDIAITQNFVDTYSLRLGGEMRVHDMFEVRAGGFWEGGATPEKQVSVALVDTPKVQVGGGGSVYVLDERLRLDLAAALLFFGTTEIRNSELRQVDSGVVPNATPLIVGNGDISASGWITGAQVSWALGRTDDDE